MLATLLKEADSLTIPQVSRPMSDIDHEDSHETHVDSRELPEDHADYENSLEVQFDGQLFRSKEGRHEKPEENRFKRNSFHRPRPGATQRQQQPIRHMFEDDDDSLEDLNEKLMKQQRRRPATSQQDRKKPVQSHQWMDTSDEQPSWEVKDESLKNLFGVYWESIKDKKSNRPSKASMEDSMEDMRKQQHKAQHPAPIRNRHTF
jgi:hypothetical protein